MASDRKQIKINLPEELHRKLKIISDRDGTPLAQMAIVALLERYKDELRAMDSKPK